MGASSSSSAGGAPPAAPSAASASSSAPPSLPPFSTPGYTPPATVEGRLAALDASAVPGPAGHTRVFGTPTAYRPFSTRDATASTTAAFVSPPQTADQAAELVAMKQARRQCARDKWATLKGNSLWLIAMPLGATVALLSPNHWRLGMRVGPWAVLAAGANFIDGQERDRECALQHPYPRWMIEQAVPRSEADKLVKNPMMRQAMLEIQEEDKRAKQAQAK